MAKKKAAVETSAGPENHFTYNGKKYSVKMQKVIMPVGGERMVLTAADICATEEAQKYLIEAGCIGSVLEEVIE